VLVAAGVCVGVLAGASVGCGVGLANGMWVGAGVTVRGASLVVAIAVALGSDELVGIVGAFPLLGVRSTGTTAVGVSVGRAVGVGELIDAAIGAGGARIATGTTAGSSANTLLSCSAASAAWALAGGISGIAPISQA
jgi:hypothetical protein